MFSLAFAVPSFLQVSSVILLVLGFGFVIFFHEMGHFLAAKWVGIKVEQFAVGFGQALVSFRKGIGMRFGNTQKEYQHRLDQYIESKHGDDPEVRDKSTQAYADALIEAEKALDLGETEYRLNWIPLGGYVKMLGQDDLRPNAEASDPRSYNRKSIGARMVVVSAGVILNVILAGLGFMILFLIGFHVPPAWVGGIVSGSPAQATVTIDGKPRPLQPGDKILEFEGKPQEDFTKIGLNVALAAENTPVPIKVQHVDGTVEELRITPRVNPTTSFLSIGIRAPQMLQGLEKKDVDEELQKEAKTLEAAEFRAVGPGDIITQINGKDVDYRSDYWKLSEALQDPHGSPVELTILRDETRKLDQTTILPHFSPGFGGTALELAGMTPRPLIPAIQPTSTAKGKISPGDIVVAVSKGNDTKPNPSTEELREMLRQAGAAGDPVNLVVIRGADKQTISNLSVSAKIENSSGQKSKGLGVQLGYDEQNPVVAGLVKDSPADIAGIPAGSTILAIGGRPVATWFDIQTYLGQARPGVAIPVQFTAAGGPAQRNLVLNDEQISRIRGLRRVNELPLRELIIIRVARAGEDHTGRLMPLLALQWGIGETRDFILQFYLTLHRMVGGTVSPDQLMGPVGIFVGGTRFAIKGPDWLLWFLAMISANLAVVNFLPIPIVDGGLFTFLILEKIQGRPLSPRAQMIAQYVGLAFLAGVFLFVTYHDILRFI